MWNEIGIIDLVNDWRFSQSSDASLFRLTQFPLIRLSQFPSLGSNASLVIAQASLDDSLEIFEPQRFFLLFPEIQIFRLRKPPCFANRALAIKGERYRFPVGIRIKIEQFLGDDMPLSNPSNTPPQISTVAASTTVASSITSVAILAANAARRGATIWNASTATLFMDLDAAASATDYAARLDPGGYYEVPYNFTGAISGIWSAANGNALVREFS